MLEISLYIVDISSIFQVSSLPDTISVNESRIKEKSENIDQNHRYISDISLIYRYIGDNIDNKTTCGTNTLVDGNFCILIDISVVISDISLMI